MPLKPITVLLADDHTIVREGLVALLKLEKDLEIVGEAENGRRALELVRTLQPSVVVMDIAMPLLNGMEATRQILQARPGTKILILSAYSDDAYVERVMSLGASGYLIKQSAARVLPEAIRAAYSGKIFFSPTIEKCYKQRRQKSRERGLVRTPKSGPLPLTPREMEVFQLIVEGRTNRESADELQISIKTIEKHRQSLMEKLNIRDVAGLTRYAIAAGIIESSVQISII